MCKSDHIHKPHITESDLGYILLFIHSVEKNLITLTVVKLTYSNVQFNYCDQLTTDQQISCYYYRKQEFNQ